MRKYSIIVPIFNVDIVFLEECVNSLVNQTYKNIEIILVNDGSDKYIYDYCEKIKKEDNRLKVVHKKNGGVSSARNFGIDIATGDYITFTDADDYLSLNTIECIDKVISSNNDIDIVKFGYLRESNVGTKIKIQTTINKVIEKKEYKNEIYSKIYNTKDYESASNAFYRLDLINKYNIRFNINISVTEDFLFFMECISKSHNLFFLNAYLYHYRINPNSVSQKYDSKKIIKKIKDEINSYSMVYELIPSDIRQDNMFISNYYKKLFKIMKNKLSLISINEKYSYFKENIKIINSSSELQSFCEFFNKEKIKYSYFYYLYLKYDMKMRKIVKKIIGR